ncbi:MAG TPA: sterol desaturase family protein [Candidatus Limnocylindrales bacterium]|nr:sterol desaturase family protein [Candidatus Limnocylindrales bacterium]
MTDEALHQVRLLGFAAALAAALLLQWWSPHSRIRGSGRVNLTLWLINVVVLGALCGACVCTAADWATRNDIGLLAAMRAPAWLAILVSLPALDLVSYAWHRANHRLPALWRLHQVHHSDAAFTVSTSLRFHPGELLLSLPIRIAAVTALGAPVAAVVVFEIVFTFANAIEHGDIDLPASVEKRASAWLVTPALHRWHHVAAVPECDSNFGTIFAVWDRLFGTYAASDSRRHVSTGLPGLGVIGAGTALMLPARRISR